MTVFARDDSLHQIIGLIYEAAIDDSLWQRVMETIVRVMQGADALLLYYDFSHPCLDIGIGTQRVFDRSVEQRYQDFIPHDFRLEGLRAKPAGVIYSADEVIPDEIMRKTMIQNEFFAPLGFPRGGQGIGGFIEPEANGRSCIISLYRSEAAEDFSQRDKDFAQALVPHFRRAFQIRRQLTAERDRADGMTAALDRLPMGVVLIAADGRVVDMNAAARRIAAENDGFSMDRDGICRGATPEVTTRLQRMIAQAAAASRGNGLHSGGALALPRPSLKEPLAALVAPLRAERVDGPLPRDGAVLFLSDPALCQVPPARVLSGLYGLTPREAELVAELVTGCSLDEAAARIGLRTESARIYLKRVFAKTGVKRQGELIALLLRSPAGLVGG
ncbi:MAG: helix-turn-helix transcriptional regulator [Magnetospirillum sp.]|nr:helix-turn-helix transcriptional regulator [Magnetospirillum sp.]